MTTGGIAPATAKVAAPWPQAHRAAGTLPLPYFGNPDGHARVPQAGAAVSTSHQDHVVGTGTPASCTSAAVVRAVAEGGVTTFSCGPNAVTIMMTTIAKVVNTSQMVVLDGGGKVTLSAGNLHQILYMDTCDVKQKKATSDCWDQEWPHLVVQNITLENGSSGVRQSAGTNFGGGGGGAIFDLGGQLTVVNSRFLGNRCYQSGPDLGGAAIRVLSLWHGLPAYITSDTFRGGTCSNGGALSSIGVSWVVTNSVLADNAAIGNGGNPATPGTRGGGSGGAIYTDGNTYSVTITGTTITGNYAPEGGGGIFFVSNNRTGTLTIKNSTLHNNPSGVFWTRAYAGVYYHSSGHPQVTNSTFS